MYKHNNNKKDLKKEDAFWPQTGNTISTKSRGKGGFFAFIFFPFNLLIWRPGPWKGVCKDFKELYMKSTLEIATISPLRLEWRVAHCLTWSWDSEGRANLKGLKLKYSGSLSSSTSFSPQIYQKNRIKVYFIESLEYLHHCDKNI